MNSFEKKVINFIRENRMVKSGDTVVVGFSGGADSTALMLVLYELSEMLEIKLTAVHVNHNIRKEAGEDAEFTAAFCRDRNIDYRLVSEDVPLYAANNKLTEEEAGRYIRYEAFSEALVSSGASCIAVAHHQNDAAETFLLNLFRGTGVHGSSSIRPVRDNIIRPLLCVSREEIESYLKEKNVLYCTDATNEENIHTRNKIRNKVIPYVLEEINSGALKHIYKATREFAKADEYIYSQARKLFDEVVQRNTYGIELDLKKIANEHEIIRRYLIMLCFEELTPNRKDITSVHIDSVLELMNGNKGSARIDLPYGLVAERAYSSFFLKKKLSEEKTKEDFYKITDFEPGMDYDIDIPLYGYIHVKIMKYDGSESIPTGTYTKWFDCDRIQEVVFRHRKSEDYIYIEQADSIHKKKLNKFMTDEKIPVNDRDDIYILAEGNNCLWIPGHRISGAYKVGSSTQKVLAISINFR